MLVLYELLHSLSKDEKRLYNLHKRNGRFQKIYEAYLAHGTFSKQIDKEVYDKEFSDVSKPFYSMQKRSLFDDVVTVLLSYSNLQLSPYRLARALAKAAILLERQKPKAALYYLEEASQLVTDETDPSIKLQLVRTRKEAEAQLGESSFAQFVELMRNEEAIVEGLQRGTDLGTVQQALSLLHQNHDQLSDEERQLEADRLLAHLPEVPALADLTDLEFFQRLEVERLYHDIKGTPEQHHGNLVRAFKELERQEEAPFSPRYFRLLNTVLWNALKVGDFLLLSGLIYKTDKLLEAPDAEPPADFLSGYLESAALYHFYENDLPTAIRECEQLLSFDTLAPEQVERVTFYHLSMMIAAHLPQQGEEALDLQLKRHRFLRTMPLSTLYRVILSVDQHKDEDELSLSIERHKREFRKLGNNKAIIDNLQLIQSWLDKKNVKPRYIPFMPTEWEELLRVDFWLQAKLDNQFYYNLVAEAWQNRKQVFN